MSHDRKRPLHADTSIEKQSNHLYISNVGSEHSVCQKKYTSAFDELKNKLTKK